MVSCNIYMVNFCFLGNPTKGVGSQKRVRTDVRRQLALAQKKKKKIAHTSKKRWHIQSSNLGQPNENYHHLPPFTSKERVGPKRELVQT